MKIKLSIFFLFLFVVKVKSQDIIYKTDGSKLLVKVVELTFGEVKYKKWDFQDGPIYGILKKDIQLLVYQDGRSEIFFKAKPTGKIDPAILGKHSISYNVLGLFAGNLYFNYERFSKNGRIGIKIPFIVGPFQSPNYFLIDNFYKKLVTGLDCNIYPTGQGLVKAYIGPSLKTGIVEISNYKNQRWGFYGEHTFFLAIGFNTGGTLMLNPKFSVGLNFGLAYPLVLKDKHPGEPDANLSISFGYRFHSLKKNKHHEKK